VPVPKKAVETHKDDLSSATPAHKTAIPATGPGLRRPPLTGVSKPPAGGQPSASQPSRAAKSPYAPRPRVAVPPAAQQLPSPQALRPAGRPRYPTIPQGQPAPNSQRTPAPVGPGGPQ
jgi:hypothetical protein